MEALATKPILPYSLDLYTLRQQYQLEMLRPSTLITDIYKSLPAWAEHNIWIHLLPEASVLARVRQLESLSPAEQQDLPLYGVPFAVKDNIDVAGLPTTAGCPEFSYIPAVTATAVQKLLAAGAILIGKTNLDQFATGLVGTRSPYGACHNAFDGRYISGGSSSGSAVAVAAGLVTFALGTDTAGSGRIPAAFNNIVGLKPTRGLVSNHGVVPACLSLDCVSIFALTCADAYEILTICRGEDSADPFSRKAPGTAAVAPADSAHSFRFGFLSPEQAQFFGNTEAARLYAAAVQQLTELGGTAVSIDYAPFLAAATLLYDGPWVAERLAALASFFQTHAGALLPVTAEIIEKGATYTAVDAFQAQYQLQALQKQLAPVWEAIDLLLVPTAGTIYTIAEVEADPITLNSNLGIYTNFVNLLDLCALALPNGFQNNGLPVGITLVAPAFQDGWLQTVGTLFQDARGVPPGVAQRLLRQRPLPSQLPSPHHTPPGPEIELAVFGLHLRGQPLNRQLTEQGGTFVRADRTSADYRLFAIHDGRVSKPGAVLVKDGTGTAVALEIWRLPLANLGAFVAQVPPPLGIGTVKLADGRQVKGFICEAYIADEAEEITQFGGWLAYLAAKKESI